MSTAAHPLDLGSIPRSVLVVITRRIGDVLCGGSIERGSRVDEPWLLDLERRHFFELARMPKTQERIAHTLATGKPLRN